MKSNFLGWFLLTSAILFSAWVYALFTLDHIPSKATIGNEADLRAAYGALGDYFGGLLNPFFGFISTCLLLLTLYYTRKDLTKTDQALEHQKNEAIISRYTNNIFQLCSVMHTRINLVEIGEKDDEKVQGYQAFKYFHLNDLMYKEEEIFDKTTSQYLNSFFNDANLWSFLGFTAQTLDYFESLLDDNSLKEKDKIALLNIMDINIDFAFLRNHCITSKKLLKRLKDQESYPVTVNQERLEKVDLILHKLAALNKYRGQNG